MKFVPSSLSAAIAAAFISAPSYAAPNNPPSFVPGESPVSTPCDGHVILRGWAMDVTDGDGETSGLTFRMTGISNPDIFLTLPWVSWPSRTLSYQLKPGTEGGAFSVVTAVLTDTSGTGEGGSDTSDPQSWTITAAACTDADLDGIADEIDPEISPLIDSDGDGIYDVLDDDDDNDGIPDIDEGNGVLDTDGDGIPNSLDLDSDSDGIPDSEETGDADGDGILDAEEPIGEDVSTDTDEDGISDDLDTDDDGDGVSDVEEGDGTVDTDDNGVPDSRDPDSEDDGDNENGSVTEDQPSVDTQSADDSGSTGNSGTGSTGNQIVETGLRGSGCSLYAGGTLDPILMLSGLLAFAGLWRRRLLR